MDRLVRTDFDVEVTNEGVERCRLGDSLGTTGLALVRYRLAPGEGLPSGLHAHADQEEVFYVLAGTATFEFLPALVDTGTGTDERSGSELTVRAGEAVRFAPGEFQSGRNGADRPLDLLALAAPRDSTDLRFPVDCPDCAHGELRLAARDDGPRFVCPACATTHRPTPCPNCGGEDLRVELGERTRTTVRCSDCEAVFDAPPME